MSQYNAGSVTLTNNSAVIVGVSTSFLANVSVGDAFTVVGSSVFYDVGAVGTDTQITLTSPYAGVTAVGQAYTIVRDFTPVLALPYPVTGDIETAALLRRALLILDGKAVGSGHKGSCWLNQALTTVVNTWAKIPYNALSEVATPQVPLVSGSFVIQRDGHYMVNVDVSIVSPVSNVIHVGHGLNGAVQRAANYVGNSVRTRFSHLAGPMHLTANTTVEGFVRTGNAPAAIDPSSLTRLSVWEV